MAPVEPPIVVAEHFLDLVEQKSNGRIEVERFTGGTLGKSNEQLDLVGGGSVDFASISISWIRDRLPLHSFMNWTIGGQDKPAYIMEQMNFVIPETSKILEKEREENGIKILTFLNVGRNGIIAREPFDTLADLKGKKIGTSPNYRALDSMGLVTVSMQIPDIYEGLAKGVIDAQALALSPMVALKWYEVSKCFMGDGHYSAGQFIGMNLDTWNKLPKDMQKIITESASEAQKWGADYVIQQEEKGLTLFKEAGLKVGVLPESDQQEMYSLEYKFRAQDMLDLCEPKGKVEEAKIILKNLDNLTGVQSQ